MKDKLKIACIGSGSSGTSHMIMLEHYEPGCCVAFCDRDRRLFDDYLQKAFLTTDSRIDATSLRQNFRDLPFYTDPEKMFDKEDINTVVIATYCSSHYEMVERAVKRGMNILLEKPIAITAEDIEKCWQLLRDYPKVVIVNFTMRGAPVSIAARKHVKDGDIGKVISVQYVNNVHYGDGYFRNWMRTRKNIGDLFLQKATHDFDIINNVIGLKPVAIAAFGSRLVYGGDRPDSLTCDECERKWNCPMSIYRRQLDAARALPRRHLRKCVYAGEIDIDDNQVVIIQYEGGVTASYSQTFNAPTEFGQRGGYFIGTKGIMDLKYYGAFSEDPQGNMRVGESHIDISLFNAKPGSRIQEAYDWAGHNHFDGTEYGILAKLDLLHGRSSEVAGTIKEGYISAKMCLAAQESIETGQVVRLKLNL